jgi:hypothetical protein
MRTISLPTPRNETGFSFDLTEKDMADIQDIMKLGVLAWNPREKKIAEDYDDVPVFRVYTHYDPTQATTVNPYLSKAKWFPLQPAFYRCVMSTGNYKLLDMFRELIDEAIALYGKPFSAVSCLLGDAPVARHVHSIDPNKPVITNTYYYSLTNNPVDCGFFMEEDGDPGPTDYEMFKHGSFHFNAARPHGVKVRDANMRFFVLIDSM